MQGQKIQKFHSMGNTVPNVSSKSDFPKAFRFPEVGIIYAKCSTYALIHFQVDLEIIPTTY